MTDRSDPRLLLPERGFPESEFEERTQRMQTAMRALEVDGLLLTTEAEIRYFSAHLRSKTSSGSPKDTS